MAVKPRMMMPLVAAFLFFGIGISQAVAGPEPKITVPVERSFLLTTDKFQGDQVFDACPAGYHFASYYEIADFTALVYNNLLGYSPHLGNGPPAFWTVGPAWDRGGWIKLNRIPHPDVLFNCKGWTSNEAQVWDDFWGQFDDLVGSFMYLDRQDWTLLNTTNNSGPSCDEPQRVWCVSDPVY